jgi:hypothetical protein
MSDIRSLEQLSLKNLHWIKARIKCIARFLMALYAVQTINLSILAASACRSKTDQDQKHRAVAT